MGVRGMERQDEGRAASRAKAVPWKWFLSFLALAAVVTAGGYLLAGSQRAELRGRAESELAAVADLKAGEISRWREELLGDAAVAARSPFFSAQARGFISDPRQEALAADLRRLMENRLESHDYQAAFLLDGEARCVLSSGAGEGELGQQAAQAALQAMAAGGTAFSDLHFGVDGESIHVDLASPIAGEGAGGTPAAGALLLRIDPRGFLYPLIQSWPGDSRTAETLLVRREGAEVVFLNDLRHRGGAALQLRLPLSEERLPAAMAARGMEGVFAGRDYRGEEVLAATRAVPGSPWYVVAKEDTDEVYAPGAARTWLSIGAAALAVLALGLLLSLLWARKQGQLYRRQYRLEAERAALARHYEYLTRYANDIIVLADGDWKIVEANDRALQAYGYSRGELIGMGAELLLSPAAREGFARTAQRLDEEKSLLLETEHIRKDGTAFPVDISARVIETETGSYYQEIIRDISKRRRMQEELRASEERYRLLFRHAPIGIFYYSPDLIITDCNQRFADILRSSREKLVGLDLKKLRDARALPAIREALRGGEARYEGPYLTTTSGVEIWASMLVVPLVGGEGEVRGAVGIVEDTGERHRMQEELAQRELSLRRLTDNMLDLVSQIDTEGRLVYFSPSSQTVLGYRPEELVGTHVAELVHPEDLEKVTEVYARSSRELVPGKVEFRARRPDGTHVWVESVGNPLLDESGEPIGAIFVTRDVSERKRTEERLDRLYRCLLELSADPLQNMRMIVEAGREILDGIHLHYTRLDRGRLYTFSSARGEEGFVLQERSAEHPCCAAILDDRQEPLAVEEVGEEVCAQLPPEVRGMGSLSYLDHPVILGGRTVGCLSLFIRPGAPSAEVADLLGVLARVLALEEERLAREDELRDFVDISSHELRHPLTVIKGYTSLLLSHRDRIDEETGREILANISGVVERLERLVRQLLETARVERRKLAVEKRNVDLGELLAETVEEMRARRPSNPISLRVEEGLPKAQVDAERISQVLVILLENAVNFSPRGAAVEVEAGRAGEGGITVAVMDRGPGVPEEDRERIFERFYQVEEVQHHSTGIGLGLYIAREIVRAHGGHIQHEPREGGGSTFRLTLP